MKFYKIKKISKKKLILTFIIFLILSIKLNFFYNTYLVLINDSHSRMLHNYGYCYPMGYGFIKEIKKKYKISGSKTNIKNQIISPSSAIFLYRFNSQNFKSKKEILLNYKPENLSSIDKNFKILEKRDNCYLIEYIDD
jgi:hypothetical protein